jgi:hypothetical protein
MAEIAMTLIAENDGRDVAKIHGPYRSGYVLEYRNPGGVQIKRVSRTNVQVLRILAELVYPNLTWKGMLAPLDGFSLCQL